MMIELTEPEHSLLVTLLEGRQRELLHEISKADVHEFRRGLQEKEGLLESLLVKLATQVAGSRAR